MGSRSLNAIGSLAESPHFGATFGASLSVWSGLDGAERVGDVHGRWGASWEAVLSDLAPGWARWGGVGLGGLRGQRAGRWGCGTRAHSFPWEPAAWVPGTPAPHCPLSRAAPGEPQQPWPSQTLSVPAEVCKDLLLVLCPVVPCLVGGRGRVHLWGQSGELWLRWPAGRAWGSWHKAVQALFWPEMRVLYPGLPGSPAVGLISGQSVGVPTVCPHPWGPSLQLWCECCRGSGELWGTLVCPSFPPA